MDETSAASPYSSQWCLVGNIVGLRACGPGGAELKHGSKHFSGGTKVWCLPPQWDWSHENIVAIGRHRGSHRLMKLVMRRQSIEQWRARVVYHPGVLRRLNESRHRNWQSEQEVREFLDWLTRQPTPEA